jgi:oxygen-independent coproporphyrinogen-3 oxidase
VVAAMQTEMEFRKNYIPSPAKKDGMATLYFGGGTPSLLYISEIQYLTKKAKDIFEIETFSEFTIEANPDDLNQEYLEGLISIGVNRLSVGIQSFFDEDLKFANRRHTSKQAVQSIFLAQKAGFKNISIDLMFGLPSLTAERWRQNLEAAFSLNIQHLSAYALTVEERTAFGLKQKRGLLALPGEDELTEQNNLLNELSSQHGFVRYETSNFAKNGLFSMHNSAYWQQKPYIGIGPAAHSYDGKTRQNNISSNRKYVEGVARGSGYFETEDLSQNELYNELVFTGLRTVWGVDLKLLEQSFGKIYVDFCLKCASQHIAKGSLVVEGKKLYIPQQYWFIADGIVVDLMKDI